MKNQPTTSESGAIPRFLGAKGIAVILPVLLLLSIHSSRAGSATWLASPATRDWNTATNWTEGGPPNGSGDAATFDVSTITRVPISEETEVNEILFNAGASAFAIRPKILLQISGVGITNNSGIMQNFVAAVAGHHGGAIIFTNSATAGNLTNFTINGSDGIMGGSTFLQFRNNSTAGSGTFINNPGTTGGTVFGLTDFFESSTAGNGTFINNGGAVSGAEGGITRFEVNSTAGSATIINNGATTSGATGGITQFYSPADAGSSTLIANRGQQGGGGGLIQFNGGTGGRARVEVFGDGRLDISGNEGDVATGSIEGDGLVSLGAFSLTVGSNNLSTTFSGEIQDGGIYGGSGGSLTKSGRGKLTLRNASTYTGGTTVSGGLLRVTNTTGSATGAGSVQVNGGTLGGTGIITGAVTVGAGSSGAIILPGNSATAPGLLTINSALTFNSLATYNCVLDRITLVSGEISALEVIINGGASFTFLDVSTGTLTVGTVFTVINNTSVNSIFGTFSNLADGSVFASNGNNFQASYEGGDGNDLTLTVVP